MEFKRARLDDAFLDKGVNFENHSDQSVETAGQITTYAIAQFAAQFRTHLFSVLVVGKMARLIYWDRAGAVVTAAFSWATPEEPESQAKSKGSNTKGSKSKAPPTEPAAPYHNYLAEFFWRYTSSSAEQRGIDASVTVPTEAEATKAAHALGMDPKQPFLKFSAPDEDPETADTPSEAFYIGESPSIKRNSSLTGRATRTYVAYECHSGKVVLMKDTWRIDIEEIKKEGKIYKRLKQNKVRHIAPLLRAGDVGNRYHRTRVQDFVSEHWVKHAKERKLRPHRHYRLVLGTVGRDLTSFHSSHELVTAIKDALIGMLNPP